jgi:multidrug efflux pump subunit AcrB
MLKEKGEGRGIKEVNSHVLAGHTDLMVQVDADRAAKIGLTAEDAERQLRVIYVGQVAGQVRESAQRMLDVRVRYPDALRFGSGWFSPALLRRQLLLVPEGNAPEPHYRPLDGPRRAVEVSDIANITADRNPDEEWRENQQPAIFVTAENEPSEAGLGSVAEDIHTWMDQMTREGKVPRGYRWELGGHYVGQQQALDGFRVVLIVACMLLFILLAFQFRSVVLPLLIFMTQPLSWASGCLALWITNTPLNVSSGMGMILLTGLDMKNGILLVEYIQRLRGEGMELRQALLQAGRTRFRPILMTSLAAILGLFPLALGIGPGAQMQQPLAIMVIGGLTANMLFTRVIIPVGYLVMERIKVV